MYSISSVLLLSLLSSLSPIECYDWCPLIRQPDGTYNGLTLYNKFNRYRDIEHWMNNRNNSVEWRFHITADGILIPDEGSVINTDTDFSFELMPHLVYKWNDSQTINCKMVVTFANNSIIDLICLIFDGKDTNDVRINDLATTQMLKQLIFIGPHLVMTTELIPSYLQVNRHDRQAKIAHILTPSPPFYWKYVCKDHRYPDRDICDNWFVDKLSDDLFKSLDSSLKFNDSEILLFNIDNRPKFCIQKDRRELSEGCKSPNTLFTAFGDCFPPENRSSMSPSSEIFTTIAVTNASTVSTIDTVVTSMMSPAINISNISTISTRQTNLESSNIWLIIVIIVTIVLLFVITATIILAIVLKYKRKGQSSTQSWG